MKREEKYIHYFSHLNMDQLNHIADYFSQDAHFKDPFNDVIGIDAIKQVFLHMYQTTDKPVFIVNHHAINENILMLQWTFNFNKNNVPWSIEGSSMVTFNQDDLVEEHIDYWDPAEQIYSKIGLLKPVMGFLRSRLTAS